MGEKIKKVKVKRGKGKGEDEKIIKEKGGKGNHRVSVQEALL